MNLEYARTIQVRDILDKMGIRPLVVNGADSSFPSPFDEQQTSVRLRVDHRHNTWRDDTTGSTGGSFELVRAWLLSRGQGSTETDVLHWLRFNIGYPSLVATFGLADDSGMADYELLSNSALRERALIRYAMRQGMRYEQAGKAFRQVHVRDVVTGKEFLALGFRNEDGGYAVYSPHIAGVTPPVAINFIRGRRDKADGIHVFRTVFDYCAAVRSRGGVSFDQDSIILHAYGCSDDAATYIRGYGYTQLYSWFEGSEMGRRATEAFDWLCATEPDLDHRAMGVDL